MAKRARSDEAADVAGAAGKDAVLGEDDEPITKDGDMPRKCFYRARAHCNPLSHNDAFEYPVEPAQFDWAQLYPGRPARAPDFVDVGCGFGGLTVALAKAFPDQLTLGMEIRAKVTEFVRLRIEALRKQEPGAFQNAAVLKTNAMRYLPNFFPRAQLSKLFFCFPDPHFKTKNHRRRIVSEVLLSEYAYLLKPEGRLYTITDVEELHRWHVDKCSKHPLFQRVPDDQAETDPAVQAMTVETEESKKVARAGNAKYWAVFRRVSDEEIRPRVMFGLRAEGRAAEDIQVDGR